MEQRDINSRTRADTFGLRPDIYDALAGNMVKKTDLESLLPMSGACRIRNSGISNSNKWLPFTEQIGDMRGCHLSTNTEYGGIIFDRIGMWNVTCRVPVSAGVTFLGEVEIRLETWDPDGVMVDRQASSQPVNVGNFSVYVDASVIVDRPGYAVRVYSVSPGGPGDIRHTDAVGKSRLSAQYVYNGVFGGV